MRQSSYDAQIRRAKEKAYKKRLERIANSVDNYFCGVYMKTTDNGKSYPKRYWRGKISRWYKKTAHRAARRAKFEELGQFGGYKKCYDYWWHMY